MQFLPIQTMTNLMMVVGAILISLSSILDIRDLSKVKKAEEKERARKYVEIIRKLCVNLMMIFLLLFTLVRYNDAVDFKADVADNYVKSNTLVTTILPTVKSNMLDSMKQKDQRIENSVNSKLINYTTFADVFGEDSTGNGLHPKYVYYTSNEYTPDSAGNLVIDKDFIPEVKEASIPAIYLAITGGKAYIAEKTRDTTQSGSRDRNKTIEVTYQLVYQPVATTSAVVKSVTEKPQEQIAKKTSEYRSEDQKAIEEGLKDGSLVKLPNGDVVVKSAAETQKKVEAPKKSPRRFKF